MAKDKMTSSGNDEDDQVDGGDGGEAEEAREKKKKKKKNKDKDEEKSSDSKLDEDDDEEDGRKSRKEKKKKKKKKKEEDKPEESEEEVPKSAKKKKRKKSNEHSDTEEGNSKTEAAISSDDKDNLDIDLSGLDDDGDKSSFEKSALFKVITNEDFNKQTPKQVRKLIQKGANVFLRGEFEETYFHALMGPKPAGMESAVLAVVYQLAEAGLDVNSRDTESFTPLHIAVLNDLHPRVVSSMIKVGADPCVLSDTDQDAMDLCEIETIKDVLEFFDIGLWRLVANGEAGKIRALVNSFSKIDLKNEDGKTLLEVAEEVGNDFVVDILKEYQIKNSLVHAALAGNVEKLEKLAKRDDVDLNVKDWSYMRPSDGKRVHRPLLAETVSLGWFDCAKVMVQRGSDVNYEIEVMEGRKEPLYMYLFYLMAPQKLLDVELFKEVLKKADLSLVSDHYTLLMQSWQMEVDNVIVSHMVASGLQVSGRDKDGCTVRDRILLENYVDGLQGDRNKLREALWYVDQHVMAMVTQGQLEKLELLAQEGYDYINVSNLKGKSAIQIAKKEGHKDVVKFLEKFPDYQKKNAAIQAAIVKGNLMEVRDNLTKKLAKTRDRNGRTPLIQAVLLERRFVIKYILKEFPKSVNVPDTYGRTALHYACAIVEGNDIEDALIQSGADTELEDFDDRTPEEYRVQMGMNFIINERNQEAGVGTFLLDRYLSILYAIEDGEESRVAELSDGIVSNYGKKEHHLLLASRFPDAHFRPLVIVAVDGGQEEIALILLQNGASHHVAGKFENMEGDRTTMALEEAAEVLGMRDLSEYIRKKKQAEGEERRAEHAINSMLRRDSQLSEYRPGSTPDSLKSCSLDNIGEEDEEYLKPKPVRTQPASQGSGRPSPNTKTASPPNQESSSTCTII